MEPRVVPPTGEHVERETQADLAFGWLIEVTGCTPDNVVQRADFCFLGWLATVGIGIATVCGWIKYRKKFH